MVSTKKFIFLFLSLIAMSAAPAFAELESIQEEIKWAQETYPDTEARKTYFQGRVVALQGLKADLSKDIDKNSPNESNLKDQLKRVDQKINKFTELAGSSLKHGEKTDYAGVALNAAVDCIAGICAWGSQVLYKAENYDRDLASERTHGMVPSSKAIRGE
jgi:hypothetical protein